MTASVFLANKPSDVPFCCNIPEFLQNKVFIGSAVVVKFKSKDILGYVTDIKKTSHVSTNPAIVDSCDTSTSGLTPSLVSLLLWIANYYVAYPVNVFQMALPAFAKIIPKEIVTLKSFELSHEQESSIIKTDLRRKIVSLLEKNKFLTISRIEVLTKSNSVRETLYELEKYGWVSIERTFHKPNPKTETGYSIAFPKDRYLEIEARLKGKEQRRALALAMQIQKQTFLLSDIGVARAVLNALVKKGLLTSHRVETNKQFVNTFSESVSINHILTYDQQSVVDEISLSLNSNKFDTFLLHGVTGSGKTAVYIEIVKRAVELGKTAIVLVPEISLTPQTAARFENVFSGRIRILHSQLSDRERYDAWYNLKKGSAKIVLGARSSVFAPLENIGVIIVDEEHDASYKQDSYPYYHARDCAVMRAKYENAVCILGSATPSFESYHNAGQGKYKLVSLLTRAQSNPMPSIKLISLPEDDKVADGFSKTLYNEISKRLEKNEQIILLQNRRGFAGFVQCENCGETPLCRNCKVSMTLHSKENVLKCHYCDFKQIWKSKCFLCNHTQFKLGTAGTEKFHFMIQRLFPDTKVLRMDKDSTKDKNSHANILSLFSQKKASILIGTQMVAKGLDFPDVTLVAAIQADLGLSFPDFRSSERVFDLLFQMAGRAGRSKKLGEVFLQAYKLKHPVFNYLLNQDYDGFFKFECESRKILNFPPFARLHKIEVSSKTEENAIIASNQISQFLSLLLERHKSFEVSDGVNAVISFLKGRFRYNVFIKQKGNILFTREMWRVMEKSLNTSWRKLHVHVSLDIDTQSNV